MIRFLPIFLWHWRAVSKGITYGRIQAIINRDGRAVVMLHWDGQSIGPIEVVR